MSWAIVARKDFRDAIRAKSLWALSAIFILLAAAVAYIYAEVLAPGGELTALGLIIFLQGPTALFVSITALLIGHKSISGERESGSAKILLGLPHTRRDVVAGKVVGRTAVLAVPLLAAFAVAAIVVMALYAEFSVGDYALFTLLTLVFACAFICIAVGISTLTGSSSRSAAAAIGTWLLFQVWGIIALVALFVVNGFSLPGPQTGFPDWYFVLQGLTPNAGYSNAAAYFLPAEAGNIAAGFGDLPLWYGLLVLAGWIVLPLALGYGRFRDVDL